MTRGRVAVCLTLLLACRKPLLDPPPPLLAVEAAVPAPAGTVRNGTYTDARWPLAVPLPVGWSSVIGVADGEDRLVLEDSVTGLRVTFAATPGGALAPRPLDGCTWTFADTARYRAVKVPVEVLTATCTPDEPGSARVIAYAIAQEEGVLHVEGRIPAGSLQAGKAALDALVGAVRFR